MADVDGGTVLKDAGEGAALGSVIPGVGTLIGGAGGALIGLASGFFGKKKANSILKANPFPTQGLPNEVTANQQIAQAEATQGMPSEQYQAAQKNIQRSQQAAITAASASPGGAVRNIGAITQASNDATGNLNAQSAQMRRENIGQELSANSQVASWRDKLFDWNNKTKFATQYNYGMGLLGQSNQNLLGGADKLLGTTAGAVASGMFAGNGGRTSTAAAPTINGYSENTQGLADTGGAAYGSPAASPAGLFGNINGNAPNYLNN